MVVPLMSNAEFIAAVEDGSLRAEIDATIEPEWNAKYADNSWDAALVCFGYGPLPARRSRSGTHPETAPGGAEDRPHEEG